MLYSVYKITNNINGKMYIGCHRTENLNDGYMGSGLLIKRAIKKYGKDNFTKETLGTFESEDQMFNEEINLISKHDPEYNLHPGGTGGFSMEMRRQNGRNHYLNGTGIFSVPHYDQGFKGKKHTDETKRKMGKANSIHQTGKGNSNYGNMWITDGINSKSIKKTDPIPEGWRKGRKMPK